MAAQAKTKHINVSQEEVDKFNELAHKWWDEGSEFKPLHDINPLRLDFIHQKINLKNKKVLDVGCGGGILSESMAKLGAQSITPTAISYTGCCASVPVNTSVVSGWNTTNMWGALCACTCFTSPYVWVGACGWSDVGLSATPYSCLNSVQAQTGGIPNSACGTGVGVGGAAYAGGDQAYQPTMIGCCFSPACWVQHGNFPGGGGMSAWTQTAQGGGGFGGQGLILISWC